MKKSKALAIAIAIVLALPVLSIYGNTKLGHSNELQKYASKKIQTL